MRKRQQEGASAIDENETEDPSTALSNQQQHQERRGSSEFAGEFSGYLPTASTSSGSAERFAHLFRDASDDEDDDGEASFYGRVGGENSGGFGTGGQRGGVEDDDDEDDSTTSSSEEEEEEEGQGNDSLPSAERRGSLRSGQEDLEGEAGRDFSLDHDVDDDDDDDSDDDDDDDEADATFLRERVYRRATQETSGSRRLLDDEDDDDDEADGRGLEGRFAGCYDFSRADGEQGETSSDTSSEDELVEIRTARRMTG